MAIQITRGGQEDRLRQAGAIRVFVDVISGRQFERPGLSALVDHARPATASVSSASGAPSRNYSKRSRTSRRTTSTWQPRRKHRHGLGRRRTGVSCLWSDGPLQRRLISKRTRDGIAAARKRGRRPGRPPLDRETVSAAQSLVEAGLTPGQAAKQLGIGRATAYKIAKAARRSRAAGLCGLRVILDTNLAMMPP